MYTLTYQIDLLFLVSDVLTVSFQFSRNFSENMLEKSLALAGLPKKDKIVSSSTLMGKMAACEKNDFSNSDDEIENRTFRSSPTVGSPKEESPNDVSSPNSTKTNPPLKKRFLHNADNDVRTNIMSSPYHAPTKNGKKSPDPETSSEILRMMYASFGSANNIDTFNSFIKHKGLPNQHSNLGTGFPDKDLNKQNHSPKFEKNETEEKKNGVVPSHQSTQKSLKLGFDSSEHLKSTKEESLKKKYPSTHTNQEKNSPENSSRKRKHEDEKRKNSAEVQSTADKIRYLSNSSSPVGNSKRKRFSSSESNDYQPAYPPGSINSFYKQESPWLPFVNPLFCTPSMFGSLGASSAGCSFPNYPQPNPLLMSSNPYLTNPVMLRDMMISAGAAGILPFHHNPSIYPSLPGTVSPRQLQAFHQLQSSMLFQNPSLFPANGYPFPSGMLPLSQSHIKSAANHLNGSGQPQDQRPNDQSECATPKKIVSRENNPSTKPTNCSSDSPVFSKNKTFEKHHSKQESSKLPSIRKQRHPMPGKIFNPSASKGEDLPKLSFSKLHHRLPKSPRKHCGQTGTTNSKGTAYV